MTNQEAIERIQSIKSKVSLYDDVLALRMAEEALGNQKSIIDELEKIRVVLNETAIKNSDGKFYYLRDEWIDEYLDKHITKLKGENNERS